MVRDGQAHIPIRRGCARPIGAHADARSRHRDSSRWGPRLAMPAATGKPLTVGAAAGAGPGGCGRRCTGAAVPCRSPRRFRAGRSVRHERLRSRVRSRRPTPARRGGLPATGTGGDLPRSAPGRSDCFYEGDLAESMVAFLRSRGSTLDKGTSQSSTPRSPTPYRCHSAVSPCRPARPTPTALCCCGPCAPWMPSASPIRSATTSPQ